MQLMTKELAAEFKKVGRQEGKLFDAVVVARFFDPCGSYTWYATEYDPESREFFGFVCGAENEWGLFSLDEMQRAKGAWGVGIERELYFDAMPLRAALARDGQTVPSG